MNELFAGLDTQLGITTVAARLAVACGLGALVGLDREFRRHPAGLRTCMLTALSAALYGILSLELAIAVAEEEHVVVDPARVIQAVTAGVAFLAAGTIITQGRRVRHLTTGAAMWAAGAIGLASGLGYVGIALIATVLAVAILAILLPLERRFLSPPRDAGED